MVDVEMEEGAGGTRPGTRPALQSESVDLTRGLTFGGQAPLPALDVKMEPVLDVEMDGEMEPRSFEPHARTEWAKVIDGAQEAGYQAGRHDAVGAEPKVVPEDDKAWGQDAPAGGQDAVVPKVEQEGDKAGGQDAPAGAEPQAAQGERARRKRVSESGTGDGDAREDKLWSERHPIMDVDCQATGSDLLSRIEWKPDPTKEEVQQEALSLIERLNLPEEEPRAELWTQGTLERLRMQFELINKSSEKAPDTSLRSYQRDLLATCVARDTICVMATGTGKTLIAVSLVNQLLEGKPDAKAYIICPTVLLVQQQALYFETNSPFNVALFYGEIHGLEKWRRPDWQQRIAGAQILCFTPTIALDALRHKFLDLQQCAVFIMDECHHANSGDHPMRQLMLQVSSPFFVSSLLLLVSFLSSFSQTPFLIRWPVWSRDRVCWV